MSQATTASPSDKPRLSGILGWIERVGNKVPHPIILFIGFFLLTLFLSAILSRTGFGAVNPVNNKPVSVINLLTSVNISAILTSIHTVFVGFSPVATVFVATLGLGIANGSGLLTGILRLASSFKSKFLLTTLVVMIGIQGNLVGDAAFVIFPPLIAVVYLNLGRNPLAGLFTSYASVACGFGAALVVGAGDASLAGMTEAAARLIDPTIVISPASGYYFMLASCFVLAPTIAWISIHVVEKKLDAMQMGTDAKIDPKSVNIHLSAQESKAMKAAGWSLLGAAVVLAALCLKGMPFSPPEGKSLAYSSMLKAIPFVILFIFAVPGYVYGKTTGTINSFKDALNMMTNEIKTIAPFFLLCFFASQFISVFGKSNIGTIIAIKLGTLLRDSGIQGTGLFIAFVFVVAIINLFVSSMNAKWALISSIFVPMLLIAGISPAATQMAYRVGDSLTNNITPTFAYLGVILSYAQVYDKRAQTGTVLAYMIPFSVGFTIVWVGFLFVWTLLGLPIGPGYQIFL